MIENAEGRFEELRATGLLPSPKGVALAVLQLTQRDDASIQALTRLVQSDPAMAGRILRYANAAYGGSLRHIASLPHAIVFLGLFRVRQIALGFSLLDQYRTGACAAFDYPAYWTASLAAGIAAQQVAHEAQCPPDESFTCGLLAGIGRLALATVFPVEYAELLARNLSGGALREAEADRFGLDHAALSARLLEDWGLPEIFVQAVFHHEAPAATPFAPGSRAQALTNALHFAVRVGQMLNVDAARRWEQVPSLYQAAARLGLEEHEVAPVVETTVAQWQEWGRELRLPTREYQDIESLLTQPPEPAAQAEGLGMLPLRVALIAADPGLRRELAATLDALGLTVAVAADRAGALRLLEQGHPDLLLVELPAGGEEALEWLRPLRAAARHAYCIALIPAEAEAEVARLMLAGVSDYLLRDHTEAALLARLNAAQRVIALQGAVRAERESVIRASGDWARSNRRLMHEALTDALTQLPNRRYGMDRLEQECSFALHSGAPLACLMLDIDHFKRINDRYGHETGDHVLRQLAGVVQRVCRRSDVPFRYGGEEFCIVCPGTPLQDALQFGERILEAVRQERFGGNDRRLGVTVSIGAAEQAPETSAEMLLARADTALYAAKAAGRDRVVAYAPERRR